MFPTLTGAAGIQEARGSAILENVADVPIESLTITSSGTKVRGRIRELAKGQKYELRLSAALGGSMKSWGERLGLVAIAAGQEVPLSIWVKVRYRTRIRMEPRWVIFGKRDMERWQKDPTSCPTKRIKVLGPKGAAFRITHITHDAPFFEASVADVTTKPNERQIEVRLVGRAGDLSRTMRGRLQIHTDDPVDRVLNVLVVVVNVRPAG
jgi:hypothetical protein